MEEDRHQAPPAKGEHREGRHTAPCSGSKWSGRWKPRRAGVQRRSQRHLRTPVTRGRPGAGSAPRAPEPSLAFWGSDPHKHLPVEYPTRTPNTLSLTTLPLTQPPSSLLKSISFKLRPVVTIRSRLGYTPLPEILTRSHDPSLKLSLNPLHVHQDLRPFSQALLVKLLESGFLLSICMTSDE